MSKMNLPQYHKNKAKKLKICQEPSCGKEFWGHPIAKYCEIHSNPKLRKRKRKVYEDVNIKNQTFNHSFTSTTDVEFTCQVPGCIKRFTVKVHPRQFTYPKYCEEHRSEFKRNDFMRQNKNHQNEEKIL